MCAHNTSSTPEIAVCGMCVSMGVYVCACVCMCAYVCACVMSVHVCEECECV